MITAIAFLDKPITRQVNFCQNYQAFSILEYAEFFVVDTWFWSRNAGSRYIQNIYWTLFDICYAYTLLAFTQWEWYYNSWVEIAETRRWKPMNKKNYLPFKKITWNIEIFWNTLDFGGILDFWIFFSIAWNSSAIPHY